MVAAPRSVTVHPSGAMKVFPRTVLLGVSAARRPAGIRQANSSIMMSCFIANVVVFILWEIGAAALFLSPRKCRFSLCKVDCGLRSLNPQQIRPTANRQLFRSPF
jgi:hypothetical protein